MYGQYDPRRTQWKKYRHQVGASIGLTGFLGELGGATAIGSDGIRDLNFNQNRITINIEYRYFIERNFSVRASFLFGFLSGSDASTAEPFRNARNLHFRAPVFELSGMIEYFLLREEPGKKSPFNKNKFIFDFYVFAGVGIAYFNPQAKYEGYWVSLQPLGTEGQGIDLQPPKYSRFTPVIPIGFGFAKKFKNFWSAGLELTYRKTFTDYLDDVSTVYYNNDKIREAYGDVAADLADPKKSDIIGTAPGDQRGDKNDKDAYLTGVITIHFYLAGIRKSHKTKRTRF
jgi:hypothetical protein